MGHATYRKWTDHTHNSSTYHKKDGTPVRAKLKRELVYALKEYVPIKTKRAYAEQ